ncbi:MAG: hypothetical protein ACK5O0_00170, partial [bacterium]
MREQRIRQCINGLAELVQISLIDWVIKLTRRTKARESNEGFDEDSLAGIKLALDEVPWQQYGGRFVILVTDAGAREAKDPRSQTQMGP